MAMADTQAGTTSVLNAVSNAMVALHKEQFGRGPTRARSNYAGADSLVCVLEDTLLPAELAMVAMGDRQRVSESRLYMQTATSGTFTATIEGIVHRKVRAFASAIDPTANIVWEIFTFEPFVDGAIDGNGRIPA
jgi:uncharacterized protein YbcI